MAHVVFLCLGQVLASVPFRQRAALQGDAESTYLGSQVGFSEGQCLENLKTGSNGPLMVPRRLLDFGEQPLASPACTRCTAGFVCEAFHVVAGGRKVHRCGPAAVGSVHVGPLLDEPGGRSGRAALKI